MVVTFGRFNFGRIRDDVNVLVNYRHVYDCLARSKIWIQWFVAFSSKLWMKYWIKIIFNNMSFKNQNLIKNKYYTRIFSQKIIKFCFQQLMKINERIRIISCWSYHTTLFKTTISKNFKIRDVLHTLPTYYTSLIS